mmetsp:Transcript_558/g.1586  ORF Transcript_558/g.1586 Transcript_558/m.1586 type:complete len:113 (-) Transcript_558:374-712(-)
MYYMRRLAACCEFGQGGPVEVFEGPISDGKLLMTDPFKDVARITKSFTLVGKLTDNDGGSTEEDGTGSASDEDESPVPGWWSAAQTKQVSSATIVAQVLSCILTTTIAAAFI